MSFYIKLVSNYPRSETALSKVANKTSNPAVHTDAAR